MPTYKLLSPIKEADAELRRLGFEFEFSLNGNFTTDYSVKIGYRSGAQRVQIHLRQFGVDEYYLWTDMLGLENTELKLERMSFID